MLKGLSGLYPGKLTIFAAFTNAAVANKATASRNRADERFMPQQRELSRKNVLSEASKDNIGKGGQNRERWTCPAGMFAQNIYFYNHEDLLGRCGVLEPGYEGGHLGGIATMLNSHSVSLAMNNGNVLGCLSTSSRVGGMVSEKGVCRRVKGSSWSLTPF